MSCDTGSGEDAALYIAAECVRATAGGEWGRGRGQCGGIQNGTWGMRVLLHGGYPYYVRAARLRHEVGRDMIRHRAAACEEKSGAGSWGRARRALEGRG